MAIIPIDRQIQAVNDALNECVPDKEALAAAVLTLGVFARDPDAFRAYARELKKMKQQPEVAAVLEEFPGSYIAGIDPS